MKFLLYKLSILSLLLVCILAPISLLGADCGPGKICNPLGEDMTLHGFVTTMLRVVSQIGFLVAVIFIIYAGFLFVTSQGDTGKLDTARKAFLWAVVGTGVLLGAEIFARALKATVDELPTVSNQVHHVVLEVKDSQIS